MNHKAENKISKVALKGMKSVVASSLKKSGLDSGSSKQAASVIVNNTIGVKSETSHPLRGSVPSHPKVTVQVNSGNLAAGFGVRSKTTLGHDPLRLQNRASVRSMPSPSASVEIDMPIVNKEHLQMQVGGSVKVEKNRKPAYGVRGEIRARF